MYDWERAHQTRNVIQTLNKFLFCFFFSSSSQAFIALYKCALSFSDLNKVNPFSFCPLTHRQHKFTWIYYEYISMQRTIKWTNEWTKELCQTIPLMEFVLFFDNNIRIGLMYWHSLFHILYYGQCSLFAWMDYIYELEVCFFFGDIFRIQVPGII